MSNRVSGLLLRSWQTSRRTLRSTIQHGWSSPSCGVTRPPYFSIRGSGGARVRLLLLAARGCRRRHARRADARRRLVLARLGGRPAVLSPLAKHPLLELQDAVDQPLG